MRRGMSRDPHAGDLFDFSGRRGDLIKVLSHDGGGLSFYAKRLERGRFIWPSPADGVVAIRPARLACMLEASTGGIRTAPGASGWPAEAM
jgi:transposase